MQRRPSSARGRKPGTGVTAFDTSGNGLDGPRGIAVDPERQILVANTMDLPWVVSLIPADEVAEARKNNPGVEIASHVVETARWRSLGGSDSATCATVSTNSCQPCMSANICGSALGS